MRTKPDKVLNFFFGTTFLAIVNFTSIIGFFVLFFSKTETAIIGLVAFIVFLLVILARIFWITDKFLSNKTEHGFEKLSTSAKYHTRDGNMITYELKKFIQCKRILMDKHEHIFYWSGTKLPNISSETMVFEKIVDDMDGFKKAIFKYKTPLSFNDVFVAHIKMDIDDSDRRSSTHLEHFIKDKMQLISFKVYLLYKRGTVADARLLRRPLNTINTPYEHIGTVPFDRKSFVYECDHFEPEVGYSYRLEWAR